MASRGRPKAELVLTDEERTTLTRPELKGAAAETMPPGVCENYIIPIGPPDATARAAIWARYLGPAADSVDIDELVAASELFTPADIEFAARKGAQSGFEREIEFNRGDPARTEDYLAAIAETRPSLTEAVLAEFTDDIHQRTRL